MSGSELRLRKRELFAYLGYKPHPGQVAVHKSLAPRRVLACGVRWGKSTCAAMEAVAAMMAPSNSSLGWVVGPTYDLTERILRPVDEILRTKLSHRIVDIRPRERRIIIRNLAGGLSEVRAKSADNPDSLLGEGLDWLIIDEATRIKREVWESLLLQRLIDRKGWALLVSTPRGRDWYFQLYKRGQTDREPDYASWASPSWDNPHLSKELIEAERKRLPKETFDQEFAAEFIGHDLEPCELCGGPSPDIPGFVMLRGNRKLDKCPECGLWVNENGNTVMGMWPDGRPHLKIIDIRDGPACAIDETPVAEAS